MEKTVGIDCIVKSFNLTNKEKIKLAKALILDVQLETESTRLNDCISELNTWMQYSD